MVEIPNKHQDATEQTAFINIPAPVVLLSSSLEMRILLLHVYF
jgi:hypothetical protein